MKSLLTIVFIILSTSFLVGQSLIKKTEKTYFVTIDLEKKDTSSIINSAKYFDKKGNIICDITYCENKADCNSKLSFSSKSINTYDDNNNLTSEIIYFDGDTLHWTYNNSYSYKTDNKKRVISKACVLKTSFDNLKTIDVEKQEVKTEYHQNGKVLKEITKYIFPDYSFKFIEVNNYDKQNNLTEFIFISDKSKDKNFYKFDERGNCTQTIYGTGKCGFDDGIRQCKYNNLNQKIEEIIVNKNGRQTTKKMEYNNLGLLVKSESFTGNRNKSFVQEYFYNDNKDLVETKSHFEPTLELTKNEIEYY